MIDMDRRVRKPLILAVCAGALAAVFALYLQPGLVFTLANAVWACF